MFCQGFYALRNVHLMERRMIRYLLWDLTISGSDLTVFADRIRANYEWVPKALHVIIPDKSCEQDSIRKSAIEERKSVAPELTSAKKPTPMPISIPSTPVTVNSHCSTSSGSPLSYTTYHEAGRARAVSPIRTSHLIPLASRCHCQLVPRCHPTKSQAHRRHQEATLSMSTLSTRVQTPKQSMTRYAYITSLSMPRFSLWYW